MPGLRRFDASIGRYRIRGVMGPDEFHDGYPWAEQGGVDDNAYTNVMTAWLLRHALEVVELLRAGHHGEVLERIGVNEAELERWAQIADLLYVPFHDGVISQFAGYERLEPLDLDAYRDRYGNIGRLDLILEAEGDAANRYQIAKQADVLMLFYLLSAEELREILHGLGYELEPQTIRRTVAVLLGPCGPRLQPVRGRTCLGHRPGGSSCFVAAVPAGTRRGRRGHAGRHDRGRHPSRCDGGHG